MKKIAIIPVLLLFISCINNNPEITFINQSNLTIDSTVVSIGSRCPGLILGKTAPNQNKSGELVFCKELKNDGNYVVRLYRSGEVVKQKSFGYYTNGTSLNRSFVITLNDSLKVQSY